MIFFGLKSVLHSRGQVTLSSIKVRKEQAVPVACAFHKASVSILSVSYHPTATGCFQVGCCMGSCSMHLVMVLRAQVPQWWDQRRREIKIITFMLGGNKEFFPAIIKAKLFTSCLCRPGTHCWCLNWSKNSPGSSRPAAPALLVGRCSPWSHAAPALLIMSQSFITAPKS